MLFFRFDSRSNKNLATHLLRAKICCRNLFLKKTLYTAVMWNCHKHQFMSLHTNGTRWCRFHSSAYQFFHWIEPFWYASFVSVLPSKALLSDISHPVLQFIISLHILQKIACESFCGKMYCAEKQQTLHLLAVLVLPKVGCSFIHWLWTFFRSWVEWIYQNCKAPFSFYSASVITYIAQCRHIATWPNLLNLVWLLPDVFISWVEFHKNAHCITLLLQLRGGGWIRFGLSSLPFGATAT